MKINKQILRIVAILLIQAIFVSNAAIAVPAPNKTTLAAKSRFWDDETVRSIDAGETEGRSFRNRVAFAVISSIIGDALYRDGISPETLIPDIRKFLNQAEIDRAREKDPILAGFELNQLAYDKEKNEYYLPIYREINGDRLKVLQYKFYTAKKKATPEAWEVSLGDGKCVYVDLEETYDQETLMRTYMMFRYLGHALFHDLGLSILVEHFGYIEAVKRSIYGDKIKNDDRFLQMYDELLKLQDAYTTIVVPAFREKKSLMTRSGYKKLCEVSSWFAGMAIFIQKYGDTLVEFYSELSRAEKCPLDPRIYAIAKHDAEVFKKSAAERYGFINQDYELNSVKLKQLFEKLFREENLNLGVPLEWNAEEDLSLDCSPFLLSIAIEVLAGNADDAYREIKQTGKISVNAFKDKNSVVIQVSDEAGGIKPEIIDKIFDLDFSTKGEGLGLALAKKIIEDHGGTIEVESEVGKGTTFTIRLPRAEVKSAVEPFDEHMNYDDKFARILNEMFNFGPKRQPSAASVERRELLTKAYPDIVNSIRHHFQEKFRGEDFSSLNIIITTGGSTLTGVAQDGSDLDLYFIIDDTGLDKKIEWAQVDKSMIVRRAREVLSRAIDENGLTEIRKHHPTNIQGEKVWFLSSILQNPEYSKFNRPLANAFSLCHGPVESVRRKLFEAIISSGKGYRTWRAIRQRWQVYVNRKHMKRLDTRFVSEEGLNLNIPDLTAMLDIYGIPIPDGMTKPRRKSAESDPTHAVVPFVIHEQLVNADFPYEPARLVLKEIKRIILERGYDLKGPLNPDQGYRNSYSDEWREMYGVLQHLVKNLAQHECEEGSNLIMRVYATDEPYEGIRIEFWGAGKIELPELLKAKPWFTHVNRPWLSAVAPTEARASTSRMGHAIGYYLFNELEVIDKGWQLPPDQHVMVGWRDDVHNEGPRPNGHIVALHIPVQRTTGPEDLRSEQIPESEQRRATLLEDQLKMIDNPTIIAVGTSSYPGYDEGRYPAHHALNPLLTSLKGQYKDRPVIFVVAKDEDLLNAINEEKKRLGYENAKVLVLAGKDTVKDIEKNIKRSFSIGIDNRNLLIDNYIRLSEMLTVLIKLSKEDKINDKIIEQFIADHPMLGIKYTENQLIFDLPKEAPMDYEELRDLYKPQIFA